MSKLRKSGKTPEAPLLPEEVLKFIKKEKAEKSIDLSSLDVNLLVGNLNLPKSALGRVALNLGATKREVEVKLNVPEFGKYNFPEDIPQVAIKEEEFVIDPDAFTEVKGFRPKHLPRNPVPTRLPKGEDPSRTKFTDFKEGENYATTIFGADNRGIFQDSSYPWGTVGKVSTQNGSGSGVMIGPRHLLTVSHVIRWNANGTVGWIRFTPASYDGVGPYGTAWGTRVYYRKKVYGPTLSVDEMKHDYVVVVLDRRIGDVTGWLGSKTWSDSWDNSPYWVHVGYPGDLNGGNRPCYQNGISMDGSFWDADRHTRIFHKGDVWPGQSGGPFFAWWSNGPHAVAVQSAQNSSENTASGGSEMVDLVIRARNEYP